MTTPLQNEWTQPAPRVLFVDNDRSSQRTFERLLKFWGYEAVIAEGEGKALINNAVALARQSKCCLAIIDLRLVDDLDPEDTAGLDLARRLAPLQCIVLSAFGNQRNLREIMAHYPSVTFIGKGDAPEAMRKIIDDEMTKVSAAKRGIHFGDRNAMDAVSKTMLGALAERFSDQVPDVLAQLFPSAHKLRVQKLEAKSFSTHISTVPRPHSAILKVYADDEEPVVVKLARSKKIQGEVQRYKKHIERKVGGLFMARLERDAYRWDIGAASFSYIGDFDVRTFSTFYEDSSLEQITECLTSFFTVVWGRPYRESKPVEAASLFQQYNTVWDNWYEDRVTGLMDSNPRAFESPVSRLGLPHPLLWLKQHMAEAGEGDLSKVDHTFVAVTHGDLHGDNLLVDRKLNAWVIDFERTGEGPILQDFVELEADLLTRLETSGDNIASLESLWKAVAAPKEIRALAPSEIQSADDHIHKALATVSLLRSLAAQCTKITDARQYVTGLLLNEIFRATLPSQHDGKRRERALMLASIFCHRLEHWDEDWPPETLHFTLQDKEASNA